jgi:hypothetical protein
MEHDLIKEYIESRETAFALEQKADAALEASRAVLQKLLDASGKGPHEIKGERFIIVNRKGTLCLMPEKRKKAK